MVEGLGKKGAVVSKDNNKKLFDNGGINYYHSANCK